MSMISKTISYIPYTKGKLTSFIALHDVSREFKLSFSGVSISRQESSQPDRFFGVSNKGGSLVFFRLESSNIPVQTPK